MAPSQLQIATSVLQRLVKEEASYHKELEQQQARIAKLEAKAKAKQDGNGAGEEDDDDDGNAEFQLKQEKRALEETKAVIPGLREKITNAREKLESVLDTATNDDEKKKAVDVLRLAKEAHKDDPIG